MAGRDKRGRFVKGNNSNGGRPLGLAARARAATHDGADIVQFMLSVLHGQVESTTRDRLAAAEWFADRGWGRSVQTIDASVNAIVKSYANLDVEQV